MEFERLKSQVVVCKQVMKRAKTLVLALAFFTSVFQPVSAEAKARLIAVFVLRSTPPLSSIAWNASTDLAKQLAKKSGWDAKVVRPNGKLPGEVAGIIGAELYVVGQLVDEDGLHVRVALFRTATDERLQELGFPLTGNNIPQDVALKLPDSAGIVQEAQFINKVIPAMPKAALKAGHEGTVAVYVTIGPDGGVLGVKIGQSSGFSELDEASIRAAQESTYSAPTIDGKPARETYKVVYTFSLSRQTP